jgi:hypothetical protein
MHSATQDSEKPRQVIEKVFERNDSNSLSNSEDPEKHGEQEVDYAEASSKDPDKHGEQEVDYAEASSKDPDKHGEQEVDYAGASSKTCPKEIALVRKLDRRIMPQLFIMYVFNFLDRAALPSAKLNGIEKHLNLKGAQ